MVGKTVSGALSEGAAFLKKALGDNALTDTRALLRHILGCDELELVLGRERLLSEAEERGFLALLRRRAEGEPLAYITGHREFMSLDFRVDEGVLIPRPDTETLVEKTIDVFRGKSPAILDMCTGSGAVAVSLAKYLPEASVTGLDISERAIDISRLNAESNGVGNRCRFVLHDVLKPFEGPFDAIVSNPPYIPTDEIAVLDKTVKAFEPKIALDGGDDGLVFYRAVLAYAPACLKEGGFMAFECGYNQAQSVLALMEDGFCRTGTVRDLAGIERVVFGYKKPLA